MVEFIVSIVVTVAMLAVYHVYAARVPVDKKMTWGEAMLTSTYVFAVFFWVYGVLPHYWLEWADKGLQWRPDRFFEAGGLLRSQANGGWFPFNVTYLHLRDIIAVIIYTIVLGANIWYWNHWQSRAARADDKVKATEEPSEFGRPLVREGAR